MTCLLYMPKHLCIKRTKTQRQQGVCYVASFSCWLISCAFGHAHLSSSTGVLPLALYQKMISTYKSIIPPSFLLLSKSEQFLAWQLHYKLHWLRNRKAYFVVHSDCVLYLDWKAFHAAMIYWKLSESFDKLLLLLLSLKLEKGKINIF